MSLDSQNFGLSEFTLDNNKEIADGSTQNIEDYGSVSSLTTTSSNNDAYKISDTKLENTLNCIDKTDNLLSNFPASDCLKLVKDTIPIFIVVGAQSAGKSSVLYLISKIKLPMDSKCCTIMVIRLKLRRKDRKNSKYCVYLEKLDGVHEEEQKFDDDLKASEYLGELHESKKKESSGKFVTEYTLNIDIEGPNIPNVTLVDLPGFHSDDGRESVEKMVIEEMERESSIVLHVVKADQDYNSIIGNNIVREHCDPSRMMTVLTHMDKTDERFATNFKCIYEKCDNIFAVHSKELLSPDKELFELEKFNSYQMELGYLKLSLEIEQSIMKMLGTKIPEAKKLVKNLLQQKKLNLENYVLDEPVNIVPKTLQEVTNRFKISELALTSKLREKLDETCKRIHHAHHDIMGKVTAINLDSTIYELENENIEGDYYLQENETWKNSTGYNIVKKDDWWFIKSDDDLTAENSENPQYASKDLFKDWYNYDKERKMWRLPTDITILPIGGELKDTIREMLNDTRGMRNITLADDMNTITHFSNIYMKIILNVLEESQNFYENSMSKVFDNVFDNVFNKSNNEGFNQYPLRSGQLVEYLYTALSEKFEDIVHKFKEDYLTELRDKHTGNMAEIITNNHYFNTLYGNYIKKCAENGSLMSDSGGVEIAYCKIIAYFKEKGKSIADDGSRTLHLRHYKNVVDYVNTLNNNISDFLHLIEKPTSKFMREKNNLEKELEILSEIDQLLKKLN